MTNPLDNPGPLVADRAHARFAERRGKVLRYQVDVSPFLAMPEEPDESDWADAAWLAGPGGLLPLAGVSAPPPAGRLVRAVGAGIRARGEIPFLHAVATNPAISLYEKLGFQLRRKTAFSAARIPETLLAGPGGTRLMPGRCRYLSATSRLNKTDRISRI